MRWLLELDRRATYAELLLSKKTLELIFRREPELTDLGVMDA